MDAEQMELLERLARLRDLGALSRREFQREKEAVLRAPVRPTAVQLRALPAPGQTAAAVVLPSAAPPAPPQPRRPRPSQLKEEATRVERVGRYAGWVLWTLFSIGGLDALIDRDPLEALALLLCGLLCAPPFHRLLATRMGLPLRLLLTLVGVIVALGIGAPSPGRAAAVAAILPPKAAAACGDAISQAARVGGERAREGIARPWRKFWTDLLWARVAGRSAYEEWRATRG